MTTTLAADHVSSAAIPPHVRPEQVFEFDIYGDPRITDDVQGSYAEVLRGAPDIFWTPANGGHWMVQRTDLISDIVKCSEIFSAREMQIPRVPDPPYMIPLSVDPPANLPYRAALMPKFSPRAVAGMEPRMRQWAVSLIEEVADKGECDFIRDISSRFPVSVFMELMGLPLERLRDFRTLADAYFNARTNEEIAAMSGQILGIFTDLMDLREKELRDDLITHLLGVQVEGRPITRDEILAMCFVLFLGGMDTVTNVTGFTYRRLAEDPELQERLVAEPAIIPAFVEEGIRLHGVICTPRLVVQDAVRHGVSFRKGDMVLNILSQSGRDLRINPEPDRFDVDRPERTHLTFSTGPHLCLGHILARAEMRILTEEWVKRIPRFRLKPGVRHGFRIGTVHAIESLPIAWDLA
jgi:cytochrome P450